MCHKCVNKLLVILVAVLNNYKEDKEPLALVGILTLINRIQEKLLEMLMIETLTRDSSIQSINAELLKTVIDLLSEIEINEEVLNHSILDLYEELR